VGLEDDLRPGLVGLPDDRELLLAVAAEEAHPVDAAFALHRDLEPLGERVHARHADAVETAGDLVRALVELPSGVDARQPDLDGRDPLRRVDADRDAAPVVGHADRAVLTDHDLAAARVAGEGLVHRVVDDLPDQVVEAADVRVPDVHRGTDADGLEALED